MSGTTFLILMYASGQLADVDLAHSDEDENYSSPEHVGHVEVL